jgi:peptide/nickel transport system substrate-binding protein
MNGRSGLITFFLFLFLAVIIVLQVLSMIQSDRLYERLNVLLERVTSSGTVRVAQSGKPGEGKEYPGDEGDWLVQRLSGEPRTLNPISVERSMEAQSVYLRNIFETLFYYDPDFDGVKLKPVLAESMEISKSGFEITIKLKNNIWFSDGVPVTADDVIFTYKTIMNPTIDAADSSNYYNNVKDVIKIDDRTIKFVLKEVYWQTLESIGVFMVLPKHIYDFNNPEEFNKHRSNPIGSGPYVFEKWDVGQQIVLHRNENYWGEKPKNKKLVFKFITNSTAALQALRAHEVDFMEPSSEQFAEMAANEGFKKDFNILSYWDPSGGFSYIGWNQDTPFFSDKRVRLAMTHIVNRQAIVEHLLKGYGTVISGPFYVHGKQNDPNIKPWPYNPERAKQLLDEAGWIDTDGDGIRDKNGIAFKFKFSYPAEGATGERIVRMLKDDASKVGIDVVPDPLEWSIFIERLSKREIEAAMSGWGGTIESDPYQLFHSSQVKGRGSNYFGFNNPKADAIIEEARKAMEPEKRYKLYHRFHQILHEEQPYTFLISRQTFNFVDNRFENVKTHQLGINPLEWYVPKEKQRYK